LFLFAQVHCDWGSRVRIRWLRAGSVPEVIDDGVTGFIVDSEEEAVQTVRLVGKLSRRKIRQTFERRFTAWRMADDYVDIYHQLTGISASALKPSAPDAIRVRLRWMESPPWMKPSL
jgi:hypothetical protein